MSAALVVKPLGAGIGLGIVTVSLIQVRQLYDDLFGGDGIARHVFDALSVPDVREALLNGRAGDPNLRVLLPPQAAKYQSTVDHILRTVAQGSQEQRARFAADPVTFVRVFTENDMRRAEGLDPTPEGNRTIEDAFAEEQEAEESRGVFSTLRKVADDAIRGTQRAVIEMAIWIVLAYATLRVLEQ